MSAYFKLKDFISQTIQYPSTTILLTCIPYVVTNAFVLSIIEKLYFKVYLMRRIELLGKYAPIIIAVLFSIYHFEVPWSKVMRIFAIIPITYSVWKTRISIMVSWCITLTILGAV